MIRKTFIVILLFAAALAAKAQSTNPLSLMPQPKSVAVQSGSFMITGQFNIGIKGPASNKLVAAANRFYLQLGKRTGIIFQQEYVTATDNNADAELLISFAKNIMPETGMDESYNLSVSSSKIALTATTDIGALRGLETLYQLVTAGNDGYFIPAVEIADSPRFKWRGLMIDVARHFIPMEVVKRNIEAMAEVKMNVLHLHLSDDEGFRVESKTYPKLQQLGSNELYYTQAQIKDMVAYAHERGIIVVPEFDLPGHCTSILAAYPFLASYPANYKPARRFNIDTMKNPSMGKVMKMLNETQTPTIDPAKETTYTFFDGFIKEMSGLFPDAYFHVGADENNGVAWKQNPSIMAFMKTKGMKNTDELQAYFVKRMYTITKKYKKRLIGWEEAFNPALPEDVIVQKWKPATDERFANSVIKHNNQLIISAGFYLDLYMPAHIHYANELVPANLSQADADKGILGGEAAIWSELVNGENEELRVWPRAAAIAERLWSPVEVKDKDDMYRRLWAVDFEFNDRGLEEESNHIKMLLRWVNGADVAPIQTVADLYTPIKGYKRLMGAMFVPVKAHPNLSSPLVNVADAIHCDSEPRWYFKKLVAAYLAGHDAARLEELKQQLQAWQNNKAKFDALALNSPYLQQIRDLSNQLSAASTIALQALNGEGSKDEQLKQLQQMEKPLHDVELSIMPEIEALVSGTLKAEPASYPMF